MDAFCHLFAMLSQNGGGGGVGGYKSDNGKADILRAISELQSHLADIGNETARLGEEMCLLSTHNEAKGSLDRSSGAGHVDDAIQSARHTFPPS